MLLRLLDVGSFRSANEQERRSIRKQKHVYCFVVLLIAVLNPALK